MMLKLKNTGDQALSWALSAIVGRHLTPPCFCSLSVMGIKPRAERFLHGHLNLLDINRSLRSQHLKLCHCWRCLSSKQMSLKSEGKIIRFFLPNSTSTPKPRQLNLPSVACGCCWTHTAKGGAFLGWSLGRRVPQTPLWGQTPVWDRPQGCLGAQPTLPGRAEWVQNTLAAMAVKGFPALATVNRVKNLLMFARE